MKNWLKNQQGDTIVEVLIAIVIVSLVLTGAYVSSNQSLNATRQAEERGQALKYVEGQVEQLKAHVSEAATKTEDFCFANDGLGSIVLVTVAGTPNDKCFAGGIPGSYRLSITPQVLGRYTITATWDRANGGANQNLKIVYGIN